jgi:hypothetical protein
MSASPRAESGAALRPRQLSAPITTAYWKGVIREPLHAQFGDRYDGSSALTDSGRLLPSCPEQLRGPMAHQVGLTKHRPAVRLLRSIHVPGINKRVSDATTLNQRMRSYKCDPSGEKYRPSRNIWHSQSACGRSACKSSFASLSRSYATRRMFRFWPSTSR